MIALYIIGGLLLLVLLVLLLRLRFMISYYGGLPRLDIKLGFFTYEDCFGGGDLESLELQSAIEKKKKKGKAKKEEKKTPKISDVLNVIKNGLCLFYKYFSRYTRLDKYSVRISLATDDPAKTAVLYGGLSGAIGSLHEWAVSVKNKSKSTVVYTEYKPDFYSEKPDIALDIHVSLRVWQLLVCLWILYRTYKRIKRLPPKADKKGDTK